MHRCTRVLLYNANYEHEPENEKIYDIKRTFFFIILYCTIHIVLTLLCVYLS